MGYQETPSSSATPAPVRSFKNQIELDRQAIKRDLDKHVYSTKFKQMTVKDRKDYIRAGMRKKLDARERSGFTTTARKDFPDQFDEEEEMQHLKKAYSTEIYEGMNAYDAEDDPEPLPTGGRRIKKEEESDGEDSVVASESEDNEADADSDEDSDDEGNEPNDRPVCVVVSRGFVIQISNHGVGGSRFGTKLGQEAKPKVSSVTGRSKPRGIVKEQAWKATKPSWKWVDGKLAVWPLL